MRHIPSDPTSSATPCPAPPPAIERRARVRFRSDRPNAGRAFIANSFRSMQARVLDVSLIGVGLLVPEPLELGTRLDVEFEGHATGPFAMFVEVINVTPQPEGGWRCGCDLIWKISEEELRLMLK
jgi:hypothetical protein